MPETAGGYAVFLIVLVAAVFVGSIVVRVVAGTRRGAEPSRHLSPLELAYLSGGPSRALLTALASLRGKGALQSQGRTRMTVTTTSPPPGCDLLEQAVWQAIYESNSTVRLGRHPRVQPVLEQLRQHMEHEGLLHPAGSRLLLRTLRLLPMAVLFGGIALLFLEPWDSDENEGLMFVALFVSTPFLLMARFLLNLPPLSRHGRGALHHARAAMDHLSPRRRPSWDAYDHSYVPYAVGLFGAEALITLDPGFATDVGGFGGGDSGSWSCGGGSGCGGGGGSSCGGGSSSSCGGGGGCGGGGCGGGGG